MIKSKFLKAVTSTLLALVLVFSTACTQGTSEQSSEPEVEKVNYAGTHIYTATDTDEYIVKNGKTDYVIVIPSNCSETIKTALEEFVWLFKKATGIELSSRKDNDTLQHSANTKYISLGETSLFKSSGIQIDKAALSWDGLRIVSKDSNIYLVGGSDRGTLYAVYTFMEINFHFEQYYKDCYEIDTGVSNVKFKNYDVTDIPDIPLRIRNYGIFKDTSLDFDENQFASRMRVDLDRDDVLLPIHRKSEEEGVKVTDYSAIFHNCHDYLWGLEEEKPNWFSTVGKGDSRQLCYTARGDLEEFKQMADYCAKKIQASLKLYTPNKYPMISAATITCEDNSNFCGCDACVAAYGKYGSHAGSAIIFVNEVARLVEEWMEKEENAAYRREDFKVIFFAYNEMTLAPCVWNETDNKYEPIDDKMKIRDNVGVWVAPIKNLDNQSNIYDQINDEGRKNIEAWASMSDYLYYWMYSTNFWYYMYMYDSFPFYNSEGYQYIASQNCVLLFNQAQAGQTGTATAWHNLKAYLDAKLMWNSSLNEAELIEKWFNAMFKEAAPIMRKLFNDVRTWKVKITTDYSGYVCRSIYERVDSRDYWPLALLRKWMNMCDEAIETVDKYKITDPAAYEALVGHIEAEWLSPAYITLDLWKGLLTNDVRTELSARFKSVVTRSGIKQYKEHGSYLADYIKTL